MAQVGFDTTVKKDADYTDTLSLIVYAINKHSQDSFVKSIAEKLYNPDRETFIHNLFDFYCRNIEYVLDNSKIEKVYTPARTFYEGKGDCKKAATFLSSVLVAAGIEPVLKHVFYSGNTNYSHIYVIVPNPDIEHYITLDPTNDCRYNKEVNYSSATLYFLNGKKMDLHYMGNSAPGKDQSPSLPFSEDILMGCDNMMTGLEDLGDSLLGRKPRPRKAARKAKKKRHAASKEQRDIQKLKSKGERQLHRQQRRDKGAPAPEQEEQVQEVEQESFSQQPAPQPQNYEDQVQDYPQDTETQDTYIEDEGEQQPYDEDLIYGPQSTQAVVVSALTKSKPSLQKHLANIPLQDQRGSFLYLVENNVDGIATNLAKVLGTNPQALAPVWQMVGGDANMFKATVLKGATKPAVKSINGPDYISAPKKGSFSDTLKGASGILRAMAPLSNAIIPGLGPVLLRLSDKAAFVESRQPTKKGGKLTPPPPLPSDPSGYQVPIPGSVPQGSNFAGSIGGFIFKSLLLISYSNINSHLAEQLGTLALIAPLTYIGYKKLKQKWQKSQSI